MTLSCSAKTFHFQVPSCALIVFFHFLVSIGDVTKGITLDPRIKNDKSSKILIQQMYFFILILLAPPKLNSRETQVKLKITLDTSNVLQPVAL